jgi:hypothetical protein
MKKIAGKEIFAIRCIATTRNTNKCRRYISLQRKSSPVTGLGWPRGFQEIKVPRILDNGTVWW